MHVFVFVSSSHSLSNLTFLDNMLPNVSFSQFVELMFLCDVTDTISVKYYARLFNAWLNSAALFSKILIILSSIQTFQAPILEDYVHHFILCNEISGKYLEPRKCVWSNPVEDIRRV